MSLINPGFEEGNVGWSIGPAGGIIRDGAKAYQGEWLSEQGPGALWGWGQVIPGGGATNITVPVYPGQVINASAWINAEGGTVASGVGGVVRVAWDDGNGNVSYSDGNPVVSLGAPTGWRRSTVRAVAPANARTATFQVPTHSFTLTGVVRVDSTTWDYSDNRSAVLTSPSNGAAYGVGDTIPLSVNITTDGASVTSVQYFRNGTSLGTTTAAPYGMTYTTTATGTESFYAVVTFANNQTITTPTVTVEVGVIYPEFRASNAYTYLIGENLSSLTSALPLSATIEGIEARVDYSLHILGRVKDKNIADPTSATSTVLFDVINGASIETILLSKNGNAYTMLGTPVNAAVPVDVADFTLEQDGIADGSRWVVYESEDKEVSIGGEEERFGLESISAAEFVDMAMGFRFVPNLDQVPAYADSGEAAYRIFLDRIRVSIYFDAGSVEYYFASPDKTQVIKGILASANVFDGSFRSADASGLLQLTSELEIVDGDQVWIGNDWTIHAAYPPTDGNKIGDVADIEGEDEVGMEYNGLPTQEQVRNNRSRYQMITANFYGDKDLNSIYGANGLDRAFAHNGEWFYKIYTQPDAAKDRPRHVAYHHWHLALGYEEGRVDISVVGEPYNFDGVLGASSWTIGDQVVGLLPLSGTILGVFGAKSVWGIAGTTVDNFSTQVISPNIGATEYTICDMGFPVYANAYGIYTLSQTQQYGDYLGVPMSQDISPWLRPRLVRKYTSDREVEVAWPVRHKNQYRLAFSDGYVVSMTMNGQSVPTFSKQKYFLPPKAEQVSVFTEGAEFRGVGA